MIKNCSRSPQKGLIAAWEILKYNIFYDVFCAVVLSPVFSFPRIKIAFGKAQDQPPCQAACRPAGPTAIKPRAAHQSHWLQNGGDSDTTVTLHSQQPRSALAAAPPGLCLSRRGTRGCSLGLVGEWAVLVVPAQRWRCGCAGPGCVQPSAVLAPCRRRR